MNTHEIDVNSPAGKMARILQQAHNSLVQAVEQRSPDPYSFVASEVFGTEEPTEEQRKFAKALCYRLMYTPLEEMSYSTVLGGLETGTPLVQRDMGEAELNVVASMARQACAA